LDGPNSKQVTWDKYSSCLLGSYLAVQFSFQTDEEAYYDASQFVVEVYTQTPAEMIMDLVKEVYSLNLKDVLEFF